MDNDYNQLQKDIKLENDTNNKNADDSFNVFKEILEMAYILL